MPVISQRVHLVLLGARTVLWFAVVEPHGGLNLYAHHPELQMGPVSFLVAGLFTW
ncbi:hypothetical protein OG800_26910 [Streptomyces sp. NBC_00445]|uniref:hypothetical protein n=1 Tax=Streptomyces sp. NBC_00445 TaxID=2975745 RepID=UPI002E2247CF